MITPIIFHRDSLSGDEIPAWGDATIVSSSVGLGWHGMQLEVGRGRGFHVEDYMVNGHHIAINLANEPLRQEYRDGLIWKSSATQNNNNIMQESNENSTSESNEILENEEETESHKKGWEEHFFGPIGEYLANRNL